MSDHTSCECQCKFDVRKCNSKQKWNNYEFRCKCEKHYICGKDYIWNPATCSCKNGKYLASIICNSVITYDEIIDAEDKSYDEETNTVTININAKNAISKTRKFLYFTFLFINCHCIVDSC